MDKNDLFLALPFHALPSVQPMTERHVLFGSQTQRVRGAPADLAILFRFRIREIRLRKLLPTAWFERRKGWPGREGPSCGSWPR